MYDFVDMPQLVLHGWGHYHEEYAKQGGAWRIRRSRLTRLRLDITKARRTIAGSRAARRRAGPQQAPPRRDEAHATCGCLTIRRYGFTAFQPCGNFFFASSSETAGTMITSSPRFQFTGVATWCFAVSCSESITRSTSSKLRPVLAG
jgi:hypothetical protein